MCWQTALKYKFSIGTQVFLLFILIAYPIGLLDFEQTGLNSVLLKTYLPKPSDRFMVAGSTAFILPSSVNTSAKLKPWLWYAPTLIGLPGVEEQWLFDKFLAAGISIAGVDVGESYGSPEGNSRFSVFYAELLKRGYARKPVLLGRSRGGLMALSWAASNPDKIAAFAGIYPVCDIESYPGVVKAAGAFMLQPVDLQQHLKTYNPIDRLADLAKAGVPLFAIHGDSDELVPLAANSGLLKKRYEDLGGSMALVVIPGQGHNLWPGFFRSQALVNFVKTHAGG